MNKIQQAFENKKAFIPFITGGDPTLDVTEQLLYAMEAAGADLIENRHTVFRSTAEGPVIQEANERALKAGCTTDKLFDMIQRARKKVTVPIVFLTYVNPIFTYGKERFMKRCVECGIDGIIVPDMPYEERQELAPACDAYGIDIIPLIAPTSKDRITMIAKAAKGYIYCVSSLGVTGVRSEVLRTRHRCHGGAGPSGYGCTVRSGVRNIYPRAGVSHGKGFRRSHRGFCNC